MTSSPSKSFSEVFKIQWPLFCSHGEGNVLIYNQDESIRFEAPQHWFTGDLKSYLQSKLKIFVGAAVSADRRFVIEEVLDERIWPEW